MKKAITCASRRTVFCIAALLAISACLGIAQTTACSDRPVDSDEQSEDPAV